MTDKSLRLDFTPYDFCYYSQFNIFYETGFYL